MRRSRGVPAAATGAAALALSCLFGCSPPPPAEDDLAAVTFRAGGLSPQEARGRRLFAARCATCHGDAGLGDGQNAYNLDPPPPDLSASALSEADRRVLIVSGSAALQRSPLCPPRGRALGADDVDALEAYLRAIVRLGPKAPARQLRARGRSRQSARPR